MSIRINEDFDLNVTVFQTKPADEAPERPKVPPGKAWAELDRVRTKLAKREGALAEREAAITARANAAEQMAARYADADKDPIAFIARFTREHDVDIAHLARRIFEGDENTPTKEEIGDKTARELKALRDELAQEKAQRAQAAQIEQAKQYAVTTASDAARFPPLPGYSPADLASMALDHLTTEFHVHRRSISVDQALAEMHTGIRDLLTRVGGGTGGAASGAASTSERSNGAASAAKPGNAAPPAARTLTRRDTAPTTARPPHEETEAERWEAAEAIFRAARR